ncbi:MlaD family protein [Rhizosaccharibacter radicis]|uniref:MlaD family protein n=1 Tax=Rhizosaccharibacter radicis TaxID=2782605 RepID=A0ABT1VYQ2_9PROT|nr:MlaD family protein [Acetobacteraceae bacterium KSS12]
MARRSALAVVASTGVIAVAVGFLAYALQGTDTAPGGRYALKARFLSSDGLDAGAEVAMAGVVVGRVRSVTLDPVAMVSDVVFELDDQLHLPTDSSLSIGSTSLASPAALLVTPGHARSTIPAGGLLTDTHPMVTLEQQVSEYIFGTGGLPPPAGGQ